MSGDQNHITISIFESKTIIVHRERRRWDLPSAIRLLQQVRNSYPLKLLAIRLDIDVHLTSRVGAGVHGAP